MAKLVDEKRKRLSVGQVDDDEVAQLVPDNRPENPRGMVNFLFQSTLLNLAEEAATKSFGTGRQSQRGSISISGTSKDHQKMKQNSFDEKRFDVEGDSDQAKKLNELGVGIKCKKGLKPEAPNQDSFAYLRHVDENQTDSFDFFGVFDGHGTSGHDCSNFVRECLPKLFFSDPNLNVDIKKALQNAFVQSQILLESEKSIDSRTSGTTATVAFKKGHMLHVAHVGDSRAILVCESAKGKIFGHPLTVDHKPDIPEERKRIEAAGGAVIFDGFYNHRVFKKGTTYPGLNMSRALGDVIGHKEAGISPVPDVNIMSVNSAERKDGVKFLAVVLCSDGVWEFINDDMCAQMVCKFRNGGKIDPNAAAEYLCQQSWDKWLEDTGNEIADDITCVLQCF